MNPKEYYIHQSVKKWNLFFIVFFAVVATLFYYALLRTNKLPSSIGIFDFIIMSLAIFRMIRLFVYDNIFLFLREGLMDKMISITGEEKVYFVESSSPLLRTLYKLALCPWCMGVWIALCSMFVFYMYPATYFLFLVLAVSALATLLQLLANNIGWRAEHTKITTEKLSKD
jgi:hypothetical protein